jgi:uncharacterized membrane protein
LFELHLHKRAIPYVCNLIFPNLDMNGKRLILPDVLKGVAVVLMIQVHITELFATEAFYNSLVGRISLFLGGVPAAPMFMGVMGFFFAIIPGSTLSRFRRGVQLIVYGFLLNIGLNLNLFFGIFKGDINTDPLPYFFGVDIFFLAGLSLIILAATTTFTKKRPVLLLVIALAVATLPVVLPVYQGNSEAMKFIFAYFHSNEWWSYFPVFPWLAYPLSGAAAGFIYAENKEESVKFFARPAFLIASLLVLVVLFRYGFNISSDLPVYYHHGPLFFGWAMVFITLIALFINKLIQAVGSENVVFRFLGWAGRQVTAFYVFQWLIIGNLATVIYKTVEPEFLFLWFACVLAASATLVWIWTNREKWIKIFENH